MRVAHVISSLDPRIGGPSFALKRILGMLAGSEVECSLVIGAMKPEDRPMVEDCTPLVKSLSLFPTSTRSSQGFSMKYTTTCSQVFRQADVVHIHGVWNWTSFWALSRARALGVPAVVRPCGSLDPFDLLKHPVAKRLIGRAFHRRWLVSPNALHCTSIREAQQMETFGGTARRTVLPLPVEVGSRVAEVASADARTKLGIPADAEVVLFMARIDRKKGLELLVPALDRVLRVRPKLYFLVAGAGEREIEAKFTGLLEASVIKGRTRLLGFVDGADKVAATGAADIYVLPSQNENFGISVVEAMLAGLPVVISNEVYIADDLRGGRAVEICARNVPDLADAIVRMLDAVRQDATLPAQARREAGQLYSPAVLQERYVGFYREISGGQKTA